MRIVGRKDNEDRLITSVDDWKEFAPPKRGYQWAEGRSAFELARAWCGTGTPSMPDDLRALFDSRDDTRAGVFPRSDLLYELGIPPLGLLFGPDNMDFDIRHTRGGKVVNVHPISSTAVLVVQPPSALPSTAGSSC